MNIFEEFIAINKRHDEIKHQIDNMVYNWLISHYVLWTSMKPTEEEIGTLYIGPNPNAYPVDYEGYDNFCTTKWGWGWSFTNNHQGIKIHFNTVKNQQIVSIEELLAYKVEK